MPTAEDREFVEKARSLGFIQKYKPGATKRKVVINENDGKPGGYHREHHDGSQDAVAKPRTIELGLTTKGEPV
jgi:hypothetical protein